MISLEYHTLPHRSRRTYYLSDEAKMTTYT